MSFAKFDIKSREGKFIHTVYINSEHAITINENLINVDNNNVLIIKDRDFKEMLDENIAHYSYMELLKLLRKGLLKRKLIMTFETSNSINMNTVEDIVIETECYYCKYREIIPGNFHIGCNMPDRNMVGNEYGIKKGGFYYPILFDPIWKEKKCDNFAEMKDETGNDTYQEN